MRHKPERWLHYPPGSVADSLRSEFTKITVNCIGRKPNCDRCYHYGVLQLAGLPDVTWYEICSRLWCSQCGSMGYVDVRVDWGEVINFDRVEGF